jgi:hypothetical protein
MRRHALLVAGWILAALAFLGATAVGLIAVFEGTNVPVGFTIGGRPVVFVPIAYVSIAAVAIVGVGIALLSRILRRKKFRANPE